MATRSLERQRSNREFFIQRTVQSLLGHSTSELTREVYLHAIPEDQRRAVASVEALLFGPKRTQVASASQTSV